MDRIPLIGFCAAILTAALLFMVWLLASDQAGTILSAQ